jgi:HD-like signal output (HDOD) protein
MTADQRLSNLDLKRTLPSLPVVALDVLRVRNDPDGDVGEPADALSRDPVPNGQVLHWPAAW